MCFTNLLALVSAYKVVLSGCGKRTVITYIARCLGLHVVEYNCHDLMTSSEKDASTALAQTFNMANR